MNMFYLSTRHQECAEWSVNSHCVKMILESAQLLSTAHRVLDGVQYIDASSGRKIKRWRLDGGRDVYLYSATHVNHPSAVWCRESNNNYNWLWAYLDEHCHEYTRRYGKIHKCFQTDLAYMLQSPPNNLKESDMTTMPSAMADEYKISDDPLTNYRNYYIIGKSRMHKWTNRQQPEWING